MMNKLLILLMSLTLLLGIWATLPTETSQAQGSDRETLGPWGQNGDVPLAGDFNADGLDDLAFFRPSTGEWFFDINGDAYQDYAIDFTSWGQSGDKAVAGDFNGDDRDDIGYFRPSTGQWFFDYDLDGVTDYQLNWGAQDYTQKPFAGDFDNDGDDDLAILTTTGAVAFFDPQMNINTALVFDSQYGMGDYIPVAGYFNNDAETDIGFIDISSGEFVFDWNMNGVIDALLSVNQARALIYVVVGDFDGNGWSDVVEVDRTSWLWMINYRGERILNPVPVDTSNANASTQYTITFSIDALRVIDGEEDSTALSSGQDEFYMIYRILEWDENGEALQVVSRAWGVYEVVAGDVYTYTPGTGRGQYLHPSSLTVNGDSDVTIWVDFMESEDVIKARNEIREWNGGTLVSQGLVYPQFFGVRVTMRHS